MTEKQRVINSLAIGGIVPSTTAVDQATKTYSLDAMAREFTDGYKVANPGMEPEDDTVRDAVAAWAAQLKRQGYSEGAARKADDGAVAIDGEHRASPAPKDPPPVITEVAGPEWAAAQSIKENAAVLLCAAAIMARGGQLAIDTLAIIDVERYEFRLTPAPERSAILVQARPKLGANLTVADQILELRPLTELGEYPKFGHNEVAAVCREVLVAKGMKPAEHDQLIYDFAKGYNGARNAEAAREAFTDFMAVVFRSTGGE